MDKLNLTLDNGLFIHEINEKAQANKIFLGWWVDMGLLIEMGQ